MFGDLLGNIEQQQQELQEKLRHITIETSAEDGAIKVVANANKELMNISIDKDKLDLSDSEQLEDLLLIAINRALDAAGEKAAEETNKLMQNMLPPGMGGLFGA